jgi:hypothetical protein
MHGCLVKCGVLDKLILRNYFDGYLLFCFYIDASINLSKSSLAYNLIQFVVLNSFWFHFEKLDY